MGLCPWPARENRSNARSKNYRIRERTIAMVMVVGRGGVESMSEKTDRGLREGGNRNPS